MAISLLQSPNPEGAGVPLTPAGDRGPRPRADGSGNDSRPERSRARAAQQGVVREALPNAMYAVELDDGRRVLSHMTATMHTHTVRIVPGDRVTVELSPYDPQRGRITQKHR